MYSVLYCIDGSIHQIGPFKTEEEADTAAREAQTNGEFDINHMRVYLICPNHRIATYSINDLAKIN